MSRKAQRLIEGDGHLAIGREYHRPLCAPDALTMKRMGCAQVRELVTCGRCLSILDFIEENGVKVRTFKAWALQAKHGQWWVFWTDPNTHGRGRYRNSSTRVLIETAKRIVPIHRFNTRSLQLKLADVYAAMES